VKIIVSVTTTKARLEVFFYVLQSLRRQTYKDYDLSVYLSRDPYLLDEGIENVPDWIDRKRVQVSFVGNSGPYRKLLPAMADAAGEDLVVTADDDVLYANTWLEKIVQGAASHPEQIVCARARRIQKNVMGRFQNYSNWPLVSRATLAKALLPIGCSGIAYRKHLLDLDFIFDCAYKDCAPTADDIWFRLASLRRNVEVYVDPGMDAGNSYILHSMGLEQLNLNRPNRESNLFKHEVMRVITRTKDYLGIPISRNDLAWIKSLEFLESKGQRLTL